MSVLETPRIYFKGEVSWDPITTNNQSYNYDENDGDTHFVTVADFRREAIAQVTTAGNWNPHGTHRSGLFDTAVNGVDLGRGTTTDDPFVQAPVELTGMLVDLEPYGSLSSQLFFDSLVLGVRGGYRIRATRGHRFTARHINFARNPVNTMIAGVASVTWQTSFAKTDGLTIDAFDSTALTTLAAALADDDVLGLTVRFNTYRTVYFDDPSLRRKSPAIGVASQRLRDDLEQGGFQPNPARSLVVGVVGLWRRGEPVHEPGDRALLPTQPQVVAGAHARVVGSDLVLDLSNSVPEVDDDLSKLDLHALRVVAVPPGGDRVTLGTLEYDRYDRAAYEASAGIVSIGLDPRVLPSLTTADLQLERVDDGAALLVEAPWRAIPETPNLYADEGDDAVAAFQVYERGRPAHGVRTVWLYLVDPNGDVGAHLTRETGADGRFTHRVDTDRGMIAALVPAFSPDQAPAAGQGPDPQADTYAYVRVRPADAAIAALKPTWTNVYATVLSDWNAMAPCMDNWLRLDDPAQVRSMGPLIKRLTDPAAFESFRFMPVTRDMSAGARALLHAFLDAKPEHTRAASAPVAADPPPAPSESSASSEPSGASEPSEPSGVERSRSLRGR